METKTPLMLMMWLCANASDVNMSVSGLNNIAFNKKSGME